MVEQSIKLSPKEEYNEENKEPEKPKPIKAAPGEAEIKLTQLDIKMKASLEDRQKYQLVFDTTGECEVFFRYKAHMIELNKLSLSISLGRITRDEAIEQVRKALVYAMRIGDRLVLNCGKYIIDYKNDFHCPVNFPTNLIFDFNEWRKDEIYKRIVRPEEDVDLIGNKKCYFMNDNFTLIILCDVRDMLQDETDKREEIKDKIPHYLDHFDTYFVTRFATEPAKAAPLKPAVHTFG